MSRKTLKRRPLFSSPRGRGRVRVSQSRRVFFETLERRDLLAVFPVANNDPLYTTALNTQLTSSTAVVANDFEADSHSITAAVVANPANGTLNSFNTSTGQFTYTPTNGFTGIDTFTYKVSNGTNDSNVATVSIAVGGVFGPRTNLDDQPLGSPLYTGANTLVQDLSLGERLIYRSDTVSLKPVIVVETSLKSGATVPNSIDAILTFNGTGQGTVSYTNTGLAAGDTLRFALQADATSLATGYYAWSMTVTANYTGSTSSTTYSGYHAVVNRTGSEFGKGWWLDGLDRLVTSGSGALLVRGNGDTLWFLDTGSGTYAKAAGDTEFSTLVKNGNNTFTLTSKHGMVENFGTTGLLTSRVDPNSNTFSYAYTDGDSDSVSDELYTITDPYSRVLQTLAYSSTRVSTITDVASHATSLAYTSGQLTSVTLTDPDGGGALAAPVWAHAYSGTTNLMTTTTDPRSKVESYTYDATSLRLSRVDEPITNQYTLLTPVQTYGLKTGTGNALVETVNPLGEFTDEASKNFRFQMDRFGNVLSFGNYVSGSSTDVTDTSRDPSGLPYKILQPAISGNRYQTLLGYNSVGDLLKIIHPDTTTETFTYQTTFHDVLTAVDELSRTTTFTYNSTGNELTRADNAGNTWTTSYGSRTDGLPVSITSPDPDGAGGLSAYVTGFAYDSAGRLTTTTNADSSTTVLAYNSADMVTSYTDELSHLTTYAFDALNRLTSITGADPDGGGSLTSPVTSFTYDAANNRLTETDALSKTTDFEYGDRNWLTKITYPDPDGAGSLGRPETTYTYDARGYRTGQGEPYYSSNDTFAFDAYGRLTGSSQGGAGGKHDDYTYDVLGRLLTHTNSLHSAGSYDQTDSYQYDSRGRVTRHTGHDPDSSGPLVGAYETFTYNAAGQPASHTDFLGNVTSYTYTTAGWLNSVTLPDPDGTGPNYAPIYTYGYDNLGQNTSLTDPNNHISTKTYSNRGLLASETGADPDGAGGLAAPTTTYGYNTAGFLTSITNPLSKVTSIGYDNLNRKTSLTLPDPDGAGGLAAPVYAYGYNAVGSLTTETDPLGNVTTTAYDNMQRRTTLTQADPDGGGALAAPVWTWTYGSSTLVTRMTDPLSYNTDYGYDTYGRQTTVTNHDGWVTTTGYNLLDQVTSVTTPDPDGAGGVTASVTSHTYDYLNRLASTIDALSGTTSFTYDLNNRLINLRDPVNNDTAWAYDNGGQVTMETNELNNTRSFWHDAAGNLTRKKDRNERVTQYTFDDLDRMTAEKWQAVNLSERSACQQHFLDLCELLGQPKPAEADPEGAWYYFEKGGKKTAGGDGWADVWMQNHFGWEYKGKHKDLVAAYKQQLQYREALENPPLLVVCDMDRFEIHTNFTGTIKKVHAFDLTGLAEPENLDKIRRLFADPESLRPGLTTQGVTKFLTASATRAPWRGQPRNTVINYRKSNFITSAVHFPA